MRFRLNPQTAKAVSDFYKLPEETVRALTLDFGIVPKPIDDDRIECKVRFFTSIPTPTGDEELVVFERDSVEGVDDEEEADK